jgi:high-affinity iron transporter
MRITSLHRRVAVGLAVGFIVGGMPLLTPQAQQMTPLDQGKSIYMGHCAGCHGFDGGGNGPAAGGMTPSPTNFKAATVSTLSDNTIQQAVLVGKGTVMRGYATILTASDLNAVVLYLRTLAAAP